MVRSALGVGCGVVVLLLWGSPGAGAAVDPALSCGRMAAVGDGRSMVEVSMVCVIGVFVGGVDAVPPRRNPETMFSTKLLQFRRVGPRERFRRIPMKVFTFWYHRCQCRKRMERC